VKARVFIVGLLLFFGGLGFVSAQKRHDLVRLSTTEGEITILLLRETPLHRENFLKLAREGLFDSTFFHRIINAFVVQGGDPNTKNRDSVAADRIGSGGPDYTVQAEFRADYIHRLGAVGAARNGDDVNPQRRSASSQFYLVEGRVYRSGELDTLARQRFAREYYATPEGKRYTAINLDSLYAADPAQVRQRYTEQHAAVMAALAQAGDRARFTPEQWRAYTSVGGTPLLDGQYTVFGYVVEGIEVMRALSDVPTNSADRPLRPRYLLKATPFTLGDKELARRYGEVAMR
jgi:peptidyl-prolyl cis-trans isomerase B (cyclophilin B)